MCQIVFLNMLFSKTQIYYPFDYEHSKIVLKKETENVSLWNEMVI